MPRLHIQVSICDHLNAFITGGKELTAQSHETTGDDGVKRRQNRQPRLGPV